ncbi:MAG TPA: class I SAM-dependent methyltransferase [Streptosporangiaceae bacterium]|nr:class I SAM-dependent methyltransferase [Streptosporangiaceae bacterium]
MALTRAGLVRPHSPGGDPDAQRRLCRGMRPTETDALRPSLAARTMFFDEQVLAAISAGIRQVVIVGAGYDDRALRFRAHGVRFFELDHPATQADKAARLHGMGVGAGGPGNAAPGWLRRMGVRAGGPGVIALGRTKPVAARLGPWRGPRTGPDGPVLAAADFRHDDVAAVLAACGHDAGQPSLFVCEGLLVYLDQPTCVRLLLALGRRAAAGSILAVSLSVHRDGQDSARVIEVANARRRAADAEPWLTILPAAAHLDLLRRAGWVPAETADAARLGTGADPGRSLLVTARLAA